MKINLFFRDVPVGRIRLYFFTYIHTLSIKHKYKYELRCSALPASHFVTGFFYFFFYFSYLFT